MRYVPFLLEQLGVDVFMTETQKFYISLVKCALNGEEKPKILPDGASLAGVCALARLHMMEYAVSSALSQVEGIEDQKDFCDLRTHAFAEVTRRDACMSEYDGICAKLKAGGISFAPLKGMFAKELYRDPYLRSMSDVDILYSGKDPKEVMKQSGYSEEAHGNVVRCFKKPPFFCFEFQKTLSREGEELGTEYDDLFLLAEMVDGSEHRLKPQYFYVYHVLHAARHYFGGGMGLRSLADLFVFRKKYGAQFDGFAKKELEKQDLWGFCQNLNALAEYCFGDGEGDEKLRLMLKYILNSGAHGSERFKLEKQMGDSKNRSGFWLSKLFPPLSVMKKAYKAVNACPLLLPVFWVWHNLKRLFRPGTVKKKKNIAANASQASVEKLQELYRISREG